MSLRKKTNSSTDGCWDNASAASGSSLLQKLSDCLGQAEAVMIGAGAGLSTSAGFTYTGERFQQYFGDFAATYSFRDMYSGGFYPFKSLREHWSYWSRYIYINRYMDIENGTYQKLYELVKEKDYFVLTTNVDHQFQKAGFEKKRLFYTQGDYGLFQCSAPCHQKTYDNEAIIRQMMEAQGYVLPENAPSYVLTGKLLTRKVPADLVPYCPVCGKPMSMNLRADHTFVEDEGWHAASARYLDFLRSRQDKRMLFLELGVGGNTPGIIKYPFWQMTAANPQAVYACINYGEAVCPVELEKQAICINGDIGTVLELL